MISVLKPQLMLMTRALHSKAGSSSCFSKESESFKISSDVCFIGMYRTLSRVVIYSSSGFW
mgnify:CR=1 FL=1